MAKKKMTGAGKTAATLQQRQARHEEEQPAGGSIQAMVWYREEHYPELLALFSDARLLPPDFAAWQARAEAKKVEVEAAGDQVIKVYIEPETFGQWCREKGLAADAEARTRLAIEVAQAQALRL